MCEKVERNLSTTPFNKSNGIQKGTHTLLSSIHMNSINYIHALRQLKLTKFVAWISIKLLDSCNNFSVIKQFN